MQQQATQTPTVTNPATATDPATGRGGRIVVGVDGSPGSGTAGAESLVVGSRGHGTLAGMLLGSVSQHCVQHAPGPVVVVPADAPELDDRAQG